MRVAGRNKILAHLCGAVLFLVELKQEPNETTRRGCFPKTSKERRVEARNQEPAKDFAEGTAEKVKADAETFGKIGGNGEDGHDVYTAAELSQWKPGQLKTLCTELGLDWSECAGKRDVVDKIVARPEGLAAAAAAAMARGETRIGEGAFFFYCCLVGVSFPGFFLRHVPEKKGDNAILVPSEVK